MPEILVLTASRRSPGNSEILARAAAQSARGYGATTEIINISSLDIEACGGCLRCVFKGDCSGKDQMAMLFDKMLKADGLIVSAPIYLLSPAAVIKKLIDRALMMSLYIDEVAQRRRGALCITVAGSARWNPFGVEVLNQLALAYGFPVYNYLEAYSPGPGEVLLREETMAEAVKLGRGLVKYLQGEEEARAPGPAQCPFCYSRSFRLLGATGIMCPVCLAEGKITGEGTVDFRPESREESFWEPAHRKRHLEEWVRATRGVYLENRSEIKKRIQEFYGTE